jgi:hypothetical protein
MHQPSSRLNINHIIKTADSIVFGSVADPDPYPTFLGLNDPDPFVKGTDPDQDFSITKQNNKKNIDSYCFVTSL